MPVAIKQYYGSIKLLFLVSKIRTSKMQLWCKSGISNTFYPLLIQSGLEDPFTCTKSLKNYGSFFLLVKQKVFEGQKVKIIVFDMEFTTCC